MSVDYRGTSFSAVYIEATTLGDAWFQLLFNSYHKGRRYLITKGSYEGGHRVEFDFAAGFIKYPHDRPLAPIMPEGINISSPTDDEKIWEYFENYLMDPTLSDHEEYKYATWINGPIPGSDLTQIDWVIKHFKESGYGTNHCFVQIGDRDSFMAYERPYTSELERGTSPCLRGIDFKIVDKILTTTVYFRSWDLIGGFPINLGGIVHLSEYVAYALDDVEPGPLAFCSKGLHVYDFYLELLKCLLRTD